jgi:hypothetical protein
MSFIDPSVGIVTKSPKAGPILIFSISLGTVNVAAQEESTVIFKHGGPI